ncbi:flagellar hook-length control protein FliK [Niallia endozanthoxylica]|uniref:Flagellar hook-length control protein FliK n=1 Tax=Niallia endozanthoxylica TaxID=2036016 RepID=A0A5J5HVZ9_9BACI|nr:flagellar hook-length control protein FliK [Niallia endozanthoxylica]KAA9025873.1 flagellar hook-length control protein FliK [Niallia endozanthoxylica]
MMDTQINSVSMAKTDFTRNVNARQKKNYRFAHLLSNLKQPNSSIKMEKAARQELPALSHTEIKEAVKLLQASDLAEIEYGSDLIEDLLTEGNTDLSMVILEKLHLNEGELRSALNAFLEEMELIQLMEELPNMELNEALMSLLQILPSININQLSFEADQEGVQLAKSFKLLELLLHYEQPNLENTQMKQLLQKTVEKLEGLIANGQNEEQLSMIDSNQTGRFMPTGSIHSLSFLAKQDPLALLQEQSGQLVSKDQLIKQFETILAKSQFITAGGNQKLFIKLYPEHLGALRIELIQQNSIFTAKILTTTENAKDLLESQILNLKQAFLNQNLQVEKIEINQQLQQERFLNRNPQKEQGQQQPNEQEEQQDSGNQTHAVSFEEVLLNVEA